MELVDRLEQTNIILIKEARPRSADNAKAFDAVAPFLRQAGTVGVPFETVSSKARAAAPSVGSRWVRYMVQQGVFRAVPRR